MGKTWSLKLKKLGRSYTHTTPWGYWHLQADAVYVDPELLQVGGIPSRKTGDSVHCQPA